MDVPLKIDDKHDTTTQGSNTSNITHHTSHRDRVVGERARTQGHGEVANCNEARGSIEFLELAKTAARGNEEEGCGDEYAALLLLLLLLLTAIMRRT